MDIQPVPLTSTPAVYAPVPVSNSPPPAAATAAQTAGAAHNRAPSVSPPTDTAVQQALVDTNKSLQSRVTSELQFAFEEAAGMSVVKLVERDSGRAIAQFPSEQILEIAKSIDRVTGSIIQRTA